MLTLPDLCGPQDILLNQSLDDKVALLECAASQLAQRHALHRPTLAAALREREQAGSTALGHGLALPHARIDGLEEARALLLRLQVPIAFDAPDQQPVHTALVLLLPRQSREAHLHLLASCARMFAERPFRQALERCHSAQALYHLLCDWADPEELNDPHFLLDSNRYFMDSEASLRPDYTVKRKMVARF